MHRSIRAQIRRHQTPPRFALLTAYAASLPGLDGSELDRLAPLAHLLRMLIKPALVSVIGPGRGVARQFMTTTIFSPALVTARTGGHSAAHVSFRRFTGTY